MTNILLIDDDPEIRSLISGFLNKTEFTVFEADDVPSAKALIESDTQFSAALVDFWLGRDNAVTLLDTLQQGRSDVPVLMISGGGQGMSIETSMAIGEVSGAVQFLQKPFTKSELLTALREFT